MSDTSSTTSSTNPRVDRLTLVQQLGSGSIGTISKAKSPKYDSFVALRQFQVPEWLDDVNELIKRLLAEARAANALDHPNIARLYTGGYKGFTVFLTSEFIEGQGIKQYLDGRAFNLNEVAELGKQLCLALDHAHEKGVLHHCLTPANLKVIADGTLKVLDFGLIRDKDIYSPIPAKRLENEHYLSPEQVKNKPADRTSNLFTAGAILYELLTTRHPFSGKHLGEVDKNITDVEPHPPQQVNSRLPEAISRVVLKALAKNPRDRFQSGKEMAEALEDALQGIAPKTAASVTTSQRIRAVAAAAPSSVTTSQKIPIVAAGAAPGAAAAPVGPAAASSPMAAAAPKPAASPLASSTGIRAAQPEAQFANQAVAPASAQTGARPPATVKAAPGAAAKPAKMPVKLLTQWKLAAVVAALLFVVSALAISLRHRTNARSAEPPPETAAPSAQPVTPANEPSTIEIREASSPRKGREKTANVEPVAATPAAPTTGELYITSVPPGATVEIAGRSEPGKTPQIMNTLSPGSYKVTVSKNGYAPETRSIEVVAGNRATLDVRLVATKGYLTVSGNPAGANILIDGKDTGKLTPSDFTLDPATHSVTVRKDGFLDNSADIKLVAGQSVSYAPSLRLAGRTDNIKVVGGFKKMFGGGGSNQGVTNVEIKSDPKGAQVIINGKTLDKSTPMEIQVEPGNYEITIQKNGYKPVHTNLSAGANEKVKIEEKLQQ
jgi:hypothetical protein